MWEVKLDEDRDEYITNGDTAFVSARGRVVLPLGMADAEAICDVLNERDALSDKLAAARAANREMAARLDAATKRAEKGITLTEAEMRLITTHSWSGPVGKNLADRCSAALRPKLTVAGGDAVVTENGVVRIGTTGTYSLWYLRVLRSIIHELPEDGSQCVSLQAHRVFKHGVNLEAIKIMTPDELDAVIALVEGSGK